LIESKIFSKTFSLEVQESLVSLDNILLKLRKGGYSNEKERRGGSSCFLALIGMTSPLFSQTSKTSIRAGVPYKNFRKPLQTEFRKAQFAVGIFKQPLK
jgi:hypothetical protein